MYKFAGYGIRTPDGELQPHLIKTRGLAEDARLQNRLAPDALVQLYFFDKLPYVEPIEMKEDNGTA